MSTEFRSSAADAFAPEERDHTPTSVNAESHFDPDGHYRLSPNVSLRPENFGALAYHFGNRRLSFLKTPELVRIVEDLCEYGSVREAVAAHDVPENQRGAYVGALASLADSEMIVRA